MFNYKVVINFSSSNCGSDDYECYRIESSGWEEIVRFCYNEFGGDVEYSKNCFNLLEWDWNLYDSDFWNMSDDNKFGLLCISEEKDCWIVREDSKYYSELWIDSIYEGNEDLNRKCVEKMESGLFNLDINSKEEK